VADAAPADLLDLLEELEVDALLVHDVAAGVGAGDDDRAELLELLDRVRGDVARTGHDDALAVERVAACAQHLLCEEDRAVAGRLGAHEGAAPGDALAGQHAGLVAVRDALVLAEQVADLAPAHA